MGVSFGLLSRFCRAMAVYGWPCACCAPLAVTPPQPPCVLESGHELGSFHRRVRVLARLHGRCCHNYTCTDCRTRTDCRARFERSLVELACSRYWNNGCCGSFGMPFTTCISVGNSSALCFARHAIRVGHVCLRPLRPVSRRAARNHAHTNESVFKRGCMLLWLPKCCCEDDAH